MELTGKGFDTNLQRQGAWAAIICASCFALGVSTLLWIAPEIYDFPDGRLKVLEEYGCLLYLWYFLVFPMVGLSVLFLNRTLTRQSLNPTGRFATVCAIVSYLTLSYMVAICAIEIMSNELLLRQQFDTQYERTQLATDIYAILQKLRSSTEWTMDLWLCLINVLLLLQKRFHPIFNVLGIAVGIIGVLILNPMFYFLRFVYFAGIIVWFLVTGIWMLLEIKQIHFSDNGT